MKTKVKFKALSGENKIVTRTITIEHPTFEVIPQQQWNGITFKETSVEAQVIQWLDSIDKHDFMVKHDFSIIFDYWIPKKMKKLNEVQNFIEFAKPYLARYHILERPFRAIISDHKSLLFGHHKSNETKMKEVLAIIDSCYKVALGTLDHINKVILSEKNVKTKNIYEYQIS